VSGFGNPASTSLGKAHERYPLRIATTTALEDCIVTAITKSMKAPFTTKLRYPRCSWLIF